MKQTWESQRNGEEYRLLGEQRCNQRPGYRIWQYIHIGEAPKTWDGQAHDEGWWVPGNHPRWTSHTTSRIAGDTEGHMQARVGLHESRCWR